MALPPSPVSFAGKHREEATLAAGGDPRFANSKVTAFYAAPNKKTTRDAPTIEWTVCVTTGSIVDAHKFRDRDDAEAFALKVDPDFRPKA
jgi:hypothetical protein